MEIIVNGEHRKVEPSITIENLLLLLGLNVRKGIAVAVNEQIIPQSSWTTLQLSHQDQLIIIQATAGG